MAKKKPVGWVGDRLGHIKAARKGLLTKRKNKLEEIRKLNSSSTSFKPNTSVELYAEGEVNTTTLPAPLDLGKLKVGARFKKEF